VAGPVHIEADVVVLGTAPAALRVAAAVEEGP
jgi:hypothetical protein